MFEKSSKIEQSMYLRNTKGIRLWNLKSGLYIIKDVVQTLEYNEWNIPIQAILFALGVVAQWSKVLVAVP